MNLSTWTYSGTQMAISSNSGCRTLTWYKFYLYDSMGVAYDHLNYGRYLPVYYAQMQLLHRDHPGAEEYLLNGGFSVQIKSENPFGCIPVDQAAEETVNKLLD